VQHSQMLERTFQHQKGKNLQVKSFWIVLSTLRKKIKNFVLESSIFSVKTSPSLENPSLENKVQLLSRNFEDRTFGAFWSTVKYE